MRISGQRFALYLSDSVEFASALFGAVSYPSDGISHFRGLLDNFLISRMHTTLFFGMLRGRPMLIARNGRDRGRSPCRPPDDSIGRKLTSLASLPVCVCCFRPVVFW